VAIDLTSGPLVMQAPIGPAATPELVAAVASAGALGCLAASWTPLDELRDQVRQVQRSVDRPFCVNLVMAFDQRERLELLAEEAVPAISLSWGPDRDAIARARAAGVTVLVQVGDADEGEQAAASGADVVVAQGVEAGGHVESRTPLHRLVGELRRRLSLPILAAGGVSDAATAAAALAAGAHGVAAGTAFLVADEADVHRLYRERLLAASGPDTVLTGLFDVGWPDAPHRVLRNATLDAWTAAGSPPPGRRPGEGETVARRRGAPIPRYSDAQPTRDTDGDVTAMAMYAGAGVDRVARAEDAATIAARLVAATRPT
jgi:NAD(P)H-dependent flavin oxidoreductase YrpB (nitropropane dioxygenase family)